MSSSDLDHLKNLIRSRDRLDAPATVAIDPDVRTGETFLLTPGMAGSTQTSAAVKALLKSKTLIGAITMVWGYDVPLERANDFATWLSRNEAQLGATAPKGVNYRGTYAVFSTTEKRTGNYRTIWGYDSLNALQAMHTAAANPGQFADLLKQFN
ncbi:MAG: hypothetical protein ACK4QW_16975, partial [Alphaproteobacteria bacterium]